MTEQPMWQFVNNLGDANPLEYGGKFLYEDTTGVYQPEIEILEPLVNGEFQVSRFPIDRLQMVTNHERVLLVLHSIKMSRPLEDYEEWFSMELERTATCLGQNLDDLHQNLCSENIILRAYAYLTLVDYHGIENFDQYPLQVTKRNVRKRYKQGELKYKNYTR